MSKENKKNVPALRFPEFVDSGDWVEKRMEKLYSFKITNSFSRAKLNYKEGKVKNIHYGDIHTKFSTLFDITKEDVPFINADVPIERINHENYCKEGDLVFADASEDIDDIGKSIELVNLNGEQLLAGLHTFLARQRTSKLVIGFGGHLFKSNRIRRQVKREAQGAKVLGISKGRLGSIKITYPVNKSEQQKIANCLSALDQTLEAARDYLAALRQHKKGLLQQLFPAEGQLLPERRFPEFVGGGDWVVERLKQMGSVINGLTYSPSDVRDTGLLVLRSSNVQNGQIDFSDCVFVREDIKGANLTQPNDILICVRNGSKRLIGKNAMIPKSIPLSTHGAFMTIFRAKFPSFVYQLFQTYLYKKQVRADLGATINSINSKNFIRYKFLIPPHPEQQKIANCLSSLDRLIEAQADKIAALEAHKRGLMQQLFPS